jgi:YidC/Oxa1 family membrane protein insertase
LNIVEPFAVAMGYIIKVLYDITLNYGIAIILFTIVVKLLTLPLTIKQQKSLIETQKLQPIVEKLQKKYSKDPEKLNMEVAKLYKEKNVNPFSGCLLLLIQFPIIFAMFYVIQQPITYMFRGQNIELPSAYAGNTYGQVYYIANERPDMLNMNFLGLDLGQVPNHNMANPILWIIPILAGVTTFLSSKITAAQQKKNQGNSETAQQTETMTKNMMTFFPIMSAYIAFIVPLGMGLYWLVNNIVTMVIQFLVNKSLYKDDDQPVKLITESK